MPIAALDQTFKFETPPQQPGSSQQPDPNPPGPQSDPLAALAGTWEGTGFNAIWVPRQPPLGTNDDRFLMLNLTNEKLTVQPIPGVIPNRGFKQGDIAMTGLTYMNEISDTEGHGLHIEPGIWAVVPATTDPEVPESIVRMASIPHGTTIIAQGIALQLQNTPPQIDPVNLIPTKIVGGVQIDFPELHLDQATPLRTAPLPPEIDQDVIDNPNILLDRAVAGQTVTSMTVLRVTTTNRPVPGGGTANTAFLEGNPHPGNENADATQVEAIFWIEEIAANGDTPAFTQLQYTQTVMLDFAGLHWPHVTVANLRKTGPAPGPVPPDAPGYGG
jgi:hypothetical protein